MHIMFWFVMLYYIILQRAMLAYYIIIQLVSFTFFYIIPYCISILFIYLYIYIYIYTQLTSSIYVSNRANLPRTGPGGPSHASVAVVDVTFVAFHDFLLATAMAEEPKVPKSVKAKGICCVSIYIYI